MPVVTDDALVLQAYDVIKETATPMESKENKEKPETIVHRYKPRFAVTQTNYHKYLKDHGITPEVVSKLTSLEQAWNTGCAKFAAEELVKVIPTMLEDKEYMKAAGPKYANATVYTSLKDGKRHVTVGAYTENRNPRAAGSDDAVIVTYGGIDIRHKITRKFSSEFAAGVEAEMEKLLKGKF